MIIESTDIRDVFIITPEAIQDERGFLMESYRKDLLANAGIPNDFIQENHSFTAKKNTIRGLHFQWDPPAAKLMRIIRGSAMMIAVDLRKGSPTLGKHIAILGSAENKKQLYAPAGFARGLLTLEDATEVVYKISAAYRKEATASIRYDSVGYNWPLHGAEPIVSEYDMQATTLAAWLESPQSDVFQY